MLSGTNDSNEIHNYFNSRAWTGTSPTGTASTGITSTSVSTPTPGEFSSYLISLIFLYSTGWFYNNGHSTNSLQCIRISDTLDVVSTVGWAAERSSGL